MRRRRSLFWVGLALVLSASAARAEPPSDRVVLLARVGPWSAVSEMIGYRGRLWFVNSVKYTNHNSADVYSYDPRAGSVRYEYHLMSQDVGDPVVFGGHLYWPSEDPRWSTGRGEYMVTDGTTWRWDFLPDGRAYHVHAMAVHDGALYAATSAWRAGLQRSRDGGASWRIVHDQDTPARKVSRITSLASFGGALYAGLTTWSVPGRNLLRHDRGKTTRVASWPPGQSVTALTAWRGRLYAVNRAPGGSRVWRTDGEASEPITALDGHFVRSLAAGADFLWAVSVAGKGGALWRSRDGLDWQRVQTFRDAKPAQVLVFGGRPYVGAIGPNGRGSLWGPPAPAPAPPAVTEARSLPRRPSASAGDLGRRLARLDRLLATPRAYRRHGPEIMALLRPLARGRNPRAGLALARRLAGPFPRAPIEMFGGNVVVRADKMARWYLMWSIAMNGHGRVLPKIISAPWTAKQNQADKYIEPPLAAIWAVARLGQDDDATLAALIARLDRPGDPPWLRGDVVGALGALSGKRFGYNVKAWRRWWRTRR